MIAFLTAANVTENLKNSERTETLLALAISYDRYKAVEAILRAAKNLSILEDVLTATNVHEKFSSTERISTPFTLAIGFNDQESIKAILHAAKEKQNILKKVFNTPATIKPQNREEYTQTPLTFAMAFDNGQKIIEAVLGAAESLGMLKEVFVAIKKDEREMIKGLLKKAGNQGMLDKILKVEKEIENEAEVDDNQLSPSISKEEENDDMSQPSTDFDDKSTAKTTNKPIIIGSVCGVIAALAVGVGCFATGVALPILAIAGIAVAAAVLVGLVAGGITYAVSSKLEKTNGTTRTETGFSFSDSIKHYSQGKLKFSSLPLTEVPIFLI